MPKYTAKFVPDYRETLTAKRFWSKVKLPDTIGTDECWEWQAYVHISGYGIYGLSPKEIYKAHRFAYMLAHGSTPADILVCHSCDNRKCCNPAHLWLGTPKDNMQDASNKGRLSPIRGEKNGNAKLTQDQVNELRHRYANEVISQHELAAEYNVGQADIWRILHNIMWTEGDAIPYNRDKFVSWHTNVVHTCPRCGKQCKGNGYGTHVRYCKGNN